MCGWPTSLPGTPRTPDPEVHRFVAACVAASHGDVDGAIAAVVHRVATARHVEVELIVDGVVVDAADSVLEAGTGSVCAGPWGPWLPGFVREALQPSEAQRVLGVHHTPPQIVGDILDLLEQTTGPIADRASVLDPAVGGGAFLLAAAERMRGDRIDVAERFWAVDLDPVALGTAHAALSLWAGGSVPSDRFVVGDFLAATTGAHLPERVDLVVGNPPFLSQLKGPTARSADARAALRRRWPDVGGYVDDAAAFLLAGAELLASDGAMVLVQPDSILAASDAAAVRARLQTVAPIRGLWVDENRSFAASVDTVAIVAAPGDSGPVQVGWGAAVEPSAGSWGHLLAAARGVPIIATPSDTPTLAEIADVTAGFRDQYYGLVDAVVDDADGDHRLITVGLIDPLHNGWGERPARFAKQRFRHPSIDLDRVDPAVRDWIRARLVPKVLVASQTKVLEAIVDEVGSAVPSVPVVSVEPRPDAPSLWHLAALLTSPVATTLAVLDAAGSAMTADAIRVSAPRLARLPLPGDRSAWDEAAAAACRGDLDECGWAMLRAHGLGHRCDVFEFWRSRIPT